MYLKNGNNGNRGRNRKKRYGENPMGGVTNLFDVAMVFAVALLIALVTSYHLPELITPDQDVTIVKNPGEPTMEVIVKSGQEIKTLNMSETMIEEDVIGTVGTIYEMQDGGMIYVPSK
ncbi:MAG: DUF2149 domain-containing protein [Methanosarcinales archaeon]|nr:MAG: DUF2149 domain-containing protein [Methanosarcinales archaeon]